MQDQLGMPKCFIYHANGRRRAGWFRTNRRRVERFRRWQGKGAKIWKLGECILFVIAGTPFIYYLLAVYSTIDFLRSNDSQPPASDFTPPVSCLKPVKGLDQDDYENYASFCRQDYPEYEILFCVDKDDDALPILEKLTRDFPDRSIRILLGSGRDAINDKVARLVRLTQEARYDLFVIADNDVRVRPDYLRTVVAPFRDPTVGGGTCLYRSTHETSFTQLLQSVGMTSDFFAGIMVAWKLDGVKFAFGQTILARRKAIEDFGGYPVLENRPADDLLVGRLIAEQGHRVVLLPYVVEAVADFRSFRELWAKRTRWMTVMRMMRPWGHFGLIFTWGLPWAMVAFAVHPSWTTGLAYFGGYAVLRILMTWLLGSPLLHVASLGRKIALVPLWDVIAFSIWITSFTRNTIKWRGVHYSIHNGLLRAAAPASARPKQV